MAFDEETLATIRDVLDRSDRVDASRIDLTGGDGGPVVLVGSVASDEEATAAAMLVEQHVSAVDNRLRVDPGIREDTTGPPVTGPPPQTDDVTTDVDEALAENVPWDPPDAPSTPPTPAEQRGSTDRDGQVPPAADAGPVANPDEITPSAPDLSQAELERSAHPAQEEDRTDG
jgi:hypothetical protein